MRKKTIWTVVAGTSAAVLVPGVAYALVTGGASMPTEGPGIGNAAPDASVGDPGLQPPAPGPDPSAELAAEEVATSQAPSPQQVPAVETLSSAGSPLPPISALSAVTAVSPVSAPSPASPVSAQSADSPDSPQSADDDD